MLSSLTTMVRSGASRVLGARKILGAVPDEAISLAIAFKNRVERFGSDTFLTFQDQAFTFAEFDALVNRRAVTFVSANVGPGDPVALMMSNRPEFLVNVLALSRLGATPALINDSLRGASLRHAATVTAPSVAVVGVEHAQAFADAFEHQIPEDLHVFVDPTPDQQVQADTLPTAKSLSEIENGRAGDPHIPTALSSTDDLAAFIYTSGTTGLPKAGRISNTRLFMAARGMGGFALGLHRQDVFYCCLPLFHASGLMVAFASALNAGCTFALAPKFSVRNFWDDIDRTNATSFVYIGEVCRYLLAAPTHPKERTHRLRVCVGNGLREDVWRDFAARFSPGRIVEFYGATEGNVNMVNYLGRPGSCGRMPPIKKLNNALLVKFDHEKQAPLRNADGRCVPCSVDEPGELLGRINRSLATSRFDGYVGQDATEAKILRDVLEPGDAYFRSGDLLRKDRWGFFYFVDRIGDTFRYKGHNVSTNEVMDAIAQLAFVEIANVYGVTIQGADGRAGMAAICLREGAEFDGGLLFETLDRQLPPYAAPVFVRVVGKTALTATFKLKKNDLVKEGFDRTVVRDPLFIREEAEKRYVAYDDEAERRLLAGELRI